MITFFHPNSFVTGYLDFCEGIKINVAQFSEKEKVCFMYAARFIITFIAIEFLTPYSIFYNSLGITHQGSLFLFCYLVKIDNFLGTSKEEILKQCHMHIIFAIKDFCFKYFTGVFLLFYTVAPDFVRQTDSWCNEIILSVL